MEENFFKVGYSSYLENTKKTKKKWTSRIWEKISRHKLMVWICAIIIMCVIMNFWLIYQFVNILHI